MRKVIFLVLVLAAGSSLCGFIGPGLFVGGGLLLPAIPPPPLNSIPNVTFAYGLRRMLTSYTANRAVNISRATGAPSSQDIGFTNSGDFNAAAFSSFCSGTACSVTVIYDQSGNGLDCTFPSGHRPPVALSSVGVRASLQVTGDTGQFYCQTATNSLLDFTGSGHSVFSEVQYTAIDDGGGTGGGRGATLGMFTHYNNSSFDGWAGDVGDTSRPGETFVLTLSSGTGTSDGANTHLTAINDGQPHFAGWTFSSGTVKIIQDANTFTSAVSFRTPASSGQPMTMLAFGDTTIDGFFSGNFAEGYGWGRTLTSTEVATLNTNTSAYFAANRGGGSIACDVGPNFTGTIPVQAAQQGFTHCALNSDFTTASFATNPATSAATWFQGCGASSGVWKNSYPGLGGVCADWVIGSDGAVPQVLKIHFPTSQGNAGLGNSTTMETIGAYPSGAWVQGTLRQDAHNNTNCPSNSTTCSSGGFWMYVEDGVSNAFWEWDTVEFFAFNGAFLNATNASGTWNCTGPGQHCFQGLINSNWNTVGGFDSTVYNTYAVLITNNGTDSFSWCNYLNGTAVTPSACANNNIYGAGYQGGVGGQIFFSKDHLRVTVGPQASTLPTGPYDWYFKQAVVFTCPNYQLTTSAGNCSNASVRIVP